MGRDRRIFSKKVELLSKSRECVLAAIMIFNNPTMRFKSEAFIVLMMIAWTYLFHAYYHEKKVEYRYFERKGKRRRFYRTDGGQIKHWDLQKCISASENPLDRIPCKNLEFLLQLRHEIEHRSAAGLHDYLSGRYQACLLNYNFYIKNLFGERYGLDDDLSYSIQLLKLTDHQLSREDAHGKGIAPSLRSFILRFDNSLTSEELDDPRFSFRLKFEKRTVNRPGQADRVIEFFSSDSEFAESVPHERWVSHDVEKPKYLAKDIIAVMKEAGFARFRQHEHTQLWKLNDAKDLSKGFGVYVRTQWYWYEKWLAFVEAHCRENPHLYV